MPVLEIKEQPETKVKVTEENINPVEPEIRQPSKAAAEIISNINQGKDTKTAEHSIIGYEPCRLLHIA